MCGLLSEFRYLLFSLSTTCSSFSLCATLPGDFFNGIFLPERQKAFPCRSLTLTTSLGCKAKLTYMALLGSRHWPHNPSILTQTFVNDEVYEWICLLHAFSPISKYVIVNCYFSFPEANVNHALIIKSSLNQTIWFDWVWLWVCVYLATVTVWQLQCACLTVWGTILIVSKSVKQDFWVLNNSYWNEKAFITNILH